MHHNEYTMPSVFTSFVVGYTKIWDKHVDSRKQPARTEKSQHTNVNLQKYFDAVYSSGFIVTKESR